MRETETERPEHLKNAIFELADKTGMSGAELLEFLHLVSQCEATAREAERAELRQEVLMVFA